MPEITNRNATIQDNARLAFDLTSEQLTKIVSDRIVPIVDLTPQIAAPMVRLTDGTDIAAVSSAGELAVANAAFPTGASGQAIVTVSGNHVFAGAGNWTAYTVTAGKVFYVTGVHIVASTSPSDVQFRDNVTTKIYPAQLAAGVVCSMCPSSPIAFATNVNIIVTAANTIYYTITGFEQ